MFMRTISLVAVAIVAVLFIGILSLNYSLTSNLHVEITSFHSTGTTSGSSLGVVNVWFVLNLTNMGTSDIDNLTVTFSENRTIEGNRQLTYTNSSPSGDSIAEFEIGQPFPLGVIKAEETKDFMFYWPVNIDFDAPPLTATLKSNEEIIDQATATIPPIPNVKITNFVCLDIRHGTRLGPILDLFSLSYTNLAATDVSNLTLELSTSRIDKNYTLPQRTSYYGFFDEEFVNGETYPLESLKAKETKTFEKSYAIYDSLIKPFVLTATLKCKNTILDQATITVPIDIN